MKNLRLLILALLGAAILMPTGVKAADFNQSRLIDNELFIDHDSMTVQNIQDFLTAQRGFLATWRDQVDIPFPDKFDINGNKCLSHKATNKTAAEIIYEAATNWQSNYMIWRDINDNPISRSDWHSYSGEIKSCTSEVTKWPAYSLATVSPKVLLVTLQKEQSLITATGTYSTNPDDYDDPECNYGDGQCLNNNYKLYRAMGYGYPDDGNTMHRYGGFYNQINWASWQLRFNYERRAAVQNPSCEVADLDPSQSGVCWDDVEGITYPGPMTEGTFVRSANASPVNFDGFYTIDGQNIYISNQATASLYYYTPHTYPGYYGNYNFVQFYTDWFGATTAGAYQAQFAGQSNYITANAGTAHDAWFKFKNTGTAAWYDIDPMPVGISPAVLAASNPINRSSVFNAAWFSSNRPTVALSKVYKADGVTLAADQHIVQPGEIGQYSFRFTVPVGQAAGTYREWFLLILEGAPSPVISGSSVFLDIVVSPTTYTAQFAGQSNYITANAGTAHDAWFKFKNTGTAAWYDINSMPVGISPAVLAASNPINRSSVFNAAWFSSNRPTVALSKVYKADGVTLAADQHIVQPGEIGQYSFRFTVPVGQAAGTYREWFLLILEGAPSPVISGSSVFLDIVVSPTTYTAQFAGQSNYITANAGTAHDAWFKFKNTGTAAWYDIDSMPVGISPAVLAASNPINRSSVFNAAWFSSNRPTVALSKVYKADGVTLAADQHIVQPGEIGQYSFRFTVPVGQAAGTYREWFLLILEGAPSPVISGSSVFLDIVVSPS